MVLKTVVALLAIQAEVMVVMAKQVLVVTDVFAMEVMTIMVVVLRGR